MHGAGFLCFWLGGLWCPRTGVGLLVGGLHPNIAVCEAAVILGLMSAHSWAGLMLKESQGWGCPLVSEAGV